MNDYRKLYGTPRWKRLRRVILDRDAWRCQSCGKAGRLEVDHILAVHLGGDFWDAANLQALCVGCHIHKTAKENGQRRQERMPEHRRAWRDMVNELVLEN